MEKIVVLGGGESGYGSALLAQAVGLEVFISDAGSIKQNYRELILTAGLQYEEGGHTPQRIMQATTIVKSPGIPDKAPIVRQAIEQGIEVISEIEFACRYTKAKKVCITGSNGKTTTTSLIYRIMQQAGLRVAVVGNIGQSLAHSLALTIRSGEPHYDWYVIELSSFQLDGMYRTKAQVAVLLNITPDHLDRYDYSLELYAASKMRVARNQTSDDLLIYNADDPLTIKTMAGAEITGCAIPFSVKGALQGASLKDGVMCFEDFSMPCSELKIKGLHNIANALSAVAATRSIGVPVQAIANTLRTFCGVEHRLEEVGTFNEIEYINDSKATNVDSTWYALQSMTKPTIWIAGGTDKGNDYSTLIPLAKKHVKVLICMGVDNSKLIKAFEGVVPIVENSHSLEQAITQVARHAEPGDAVLLSPACASFDLFNNYEDRGRRFKDAVAGGR